MSDRLELLLGAPPPHGVAALAPADRAALAEIVETALRQQDEHLSRAFAATLRHVPFPLRAVVKRALF